MKGFEIQLKAGVATVCEDELDELLETLTELKRAHLRQPQGHRDTARYIDHDAAKEILLRVLAGNEKLATRRLGRLWSAIGRLAMTGEIAFDAYCKKCNTQLSEHLEATDCRAMIYSSKNIAVSVDSLRKYQKAFISGRTNQVGRAVREGYAALVEGLPAT